MKEESPSPESPLSDILKDYWSKLPHTVKEEVEKLRILSRIYYQFPESLQRHCVPAYLYEAISIKNEGSQSRRVLVVYADTSTAMMAFKVLANTLIRNLRETERIEIDDVKLLLRPRSEIEIVCNTLLSREECNDEG